MEPGKRQRILIIGDWVVDEYWFLVRHHSEISSHTGFIHYRIASKFGESVKDLCGAGHVARVLHQLNRDKNNNYGIIGIGSWNDNDTLVIKHLLHTQYRDKCHASHAIFTLMPNYCDSPPDIELITLNRLGPTIRVIRQYHQEGEKLQQINRIDWEPWRSHRNDKIDISTCINKLPPADDIKHIIIHDLKKGTITEDLIAGLDKKYSGAQWFIRTKDEKPNWINIIKDKIYLRVIGPEIAGLINPWDSWVKKDRLTHQAFKTITNYQGKNVVLLSEKREMIARLMSDADHTILSGKSGIKPMPLTQLNWPSTFYASLICNMIDNTNNITRDDLINALRCADDANYCGILGPSSSRMDNVDKDEPYVTEAKRMD